MNAFICHFLDLLDMFGKGVEEEERKMDRQSWAKAQPKQTRDAAPSL
jgi:hypothetical protein